MNQTQHRHLDTPECCPNHDHVSVTATAKNKKKQKELEGFSYTHCSHGSPVPPVGDGTQTVTLGLHANRDRSAVPTIKFGNTAVSIKHLLYHTSKQAVIDSQVSDYYSQESSFSTWIKNLSSLYIYSIWMLCYNENHCKKWPMLSSEGTTMKITNSVYASMLSLTHSDFSATAHFLCGNILRPSSWHFINKAICRQPQQEWLTGIIILPETEKPKITVHCTKIAATTQWEREYNSKLTISLAN